jgi:hypothetical protein
MAGDTGAGFGGRFHHGCQYAASWLHGTPPEQGMGAKLLMGNVRPGGGLIARVAKSEQAHGSR